MAKEPFEQFALPNEVRAFVEQSVAQARQPLLAVRRQRGGKPYDFSGGGMFTIEPAHAACCGLTAEQRGPNRVSP